MDPLSVVLDAFAPIGGRSLLDIGCGPGALAQALAARGAVVTGIDPNAAVIARASAAVPEGRFTVASAEELAFADGHFDGAVFLNSLHHLSDARAALAEAARVVKPGGRIVVVEPLAEGSAFEALKPVEDETEVRRAAQGVLDALITAGEVRCLRDLTFPRTETFTSLDHFLEHALAADPARAAAIRDQASTIEAAFQAAAARDPQGAFVLVQPLRACVLEGRAP